LREDCTVSCEIGASQRVPEPWNTEAEESVTLEAVTRRPPVKTQQTERAMCAVVNCKVCESAIVLQLLVTPSCKRAINPITNPNPVYSHCIT
jgi:hypothetical protein